jgi:hypothetical protein
MKIYLKGRKEDIFERYTLKEPRLYCTCLNVQEMY